MKKIIIALFIILGIVLGGILYIKTKENKIEAYNAAAEEEITIMAKENFRGYEKDKDGKIIGYWYQYPEDTVVHHCSYTK